MVYFPGQQMKGTPEVLFKNTSKPGVVVCAFNPSTREVESGGSLGVQGHQGQPPKLHRETLSPKIKQTNKQTKKPISQDSVDKLTSLYILLYLIPTLRSLGL